MIVGKEPDWQIVCEVSDGLEAVKRAEELKPDLILLDIALPKLNGVEAARRIRKLAPDSKILFLSALHDQDIAQEALHTGASGFVDKLDAERELLKAMEAVLQGKRFVSTRLKRSIAAEEGDTQNPDGPDVSGKTAITRCHEVLFYSDDVVLLESITRFIGAALDSGSAAIVFATKPHRDMLLEELKAQGVHADVLIQQGTYISLDVAETLSTFMVNDWPDADRFFRGFSNLIDSASRAAKAKDPRVAVFREGVALLWAEGKTEAAIRLEQLGNELTELRKVDILCAYPFSLSTQSDKDAFRTICAEHSAVYSG